MRIIAIPLTRPRAMLRNSIQNERATRILTYYQFQITSPPKSSNPTSPSDHTKDSWLSRWRPEGGIVKWLSTKAADTWAGFGKANGGWKVRLPSFFTRFSCWKFVFIVVEDIPSRWTTCRPHGLWRASSERYRSLTWTASYTSRFVGKGGDCNCNFQLSEFWIRLTPSQIPLVYPSSISSSPSTLEELRALLAYRIPRHRRGFIGWMLFAPVTAPFMIIRVSFFFSSVFPLAYILS